MEKFPFANNWFTFHVTKRFVRKVINADVLITQGRDAAIQAKESGQVGSSLYDAFPIPQNSQRSELQLPFSLSVESSFQLCTLAQNTHKYSRYGLHFDIILN
jgi:hypothetical protein